jgi:Fur family ferric uptake transcriptional regulator
MERATRQRAAINEALVLAGRPLLPEEILDAARGLVPGLALATVYRNLKLLADEGQIRPVQLPGENTRFEPADQAHHHHFQCRACGRVFDIQACPGGLAALAPAGFTVEDHELTLYGTCGDCGRPRRARRRGGAAPS